MQFYELSILSSHYVYDQAIFHSHFIFLKILPLLHSLMRYIQWCFCDIFICLESSLTWLVIKNALVEKCILFPLRPCLSDHNSCDQKDHLCLREAISIFFRCKSHLCQTQTSQKYCNSLPCVFLTHSDCILLNLLPSLISLWSIIFI